MHGDAKAQSETDAAMLAALLLMHADVKEVWHARP
jgi:hypothetical protein